MADHPYPRVLQPGEYERGLLPHQLTSIHEMERFEREKKTYELGGVYLVETSLAIQADPTGLVVSLAMAARSSLLAAGSLLAGTVRGEDRSWASERLEMKTSDMATRPSRRERERFMGVGLRIVTLPPTPRVAVQRRHHSRPPITG